MARTFSRPVQNYAPGTYGPFRVDQFTRDDARGIRITLTFEGLTASPVLVGELQLKWSVESSPHLQPIYRPSSSAVDRAGNPHPTVVVYFGVPRDAVARKPTVAGDATFVLTSSVRCSLLVEAVT